MIEKLISGGQTGVDRAALDVALEMNIPAGGWCPQGRRAEDGPIPLQYPLRETPSTGYTERTRWNVRDSEATLVFTWGTPTEGTALTIEFANQLGKPCLVIDLAQKPRWTALKQWVDQHGIRVLNVAGPRESKVPGIYRKTVEFLWEVLSAWT